MKGVLSEDLLDESEIPGAKKLTKEQWKWVQRRPGDAPDEDWDKTKKKIAKAIEGTETDAEARVKIKFQKPTKITPSEATFPFKGSVRVKTHVRRQKR